MKSAEERIKELIEEHAKDCPVGDCCIAIQQGKEVLKILQEAKEEMIKRNKFHGIYDKDINETLGKFEKAGDKG